VREGRVWRDDSTKQTAFSLDAGIQGGSYATLGADARIALRQLLPSLTGGVGGGSRRGSLSMQYLRSDGATLNSDFQRGTAYLQGSWDAEDYSLDLQAGYSEKAYGANTFYSAAYPNQWEHNRRFFFSAGAESKGRLRLRPEIYWNRLYDHYQLIRDTSKGENFHRTDVHGVRLTASLNWKAGRIALGAELREEGILSTGLGVPYQDDSHRYSRQDGRTCLSFNVEHTLLLPRFTLSAGLLVFTQLSSSARPLVNSSTFQSFNVSTFQHFFPGLDLAVSPNSYLRLFASYNKGFRLPTFTDLYYKSPTHEGNQGMRPEESHSFQFGATIRKTTFSPSLTGGSFTIKAFYHRGNNLIDWVMYYPEDVFHSANFNLDNLGLQAQSTLNAKRSTLNLSYAFIHQHRRDALPIYKSNYAMEYLRHKFVATLTHPIRTRSKRQPFSSLGGVGGGSLTASWTLRWQDRMGSYILYENAQSTGCLVPYSPYATLDLRLRWTTRHYELWAEGTNLTNRRYYDLGNIPQPGIMILAGVRVKL